MIGVLYDDGDIEAYLEEDEISELRKGALEGQIIRIKKPEQQGRLTLLINEKRARELYSAIGVILFWNKTNNGNEVSLFIDKHQYEHLRKYGRTGTRYNCLGSKVNVKMSRVDELHVELLKLLQGDYKGKIPRQTKLF